MLFSNFHASPARSIDRLESTRDVTLWLIMSAGGVWAFLSGSGM
jgi:hypothetical protein